MSKKINIYIKFFLVIIFIVLVTFLFYLDKYKSFFMVFSYPHEVQDYFARELELQPGYIEAIKQQVEQLLSNEEWCTPIYFANEVSQFSCYVRAEYPTIFGVWQFRLHFTEDEKVIDLQVTWRWFGL